METILSNCITIDNYSGHKLGLCPLTGACIAIATILSQCIKELIGLMQVINMYIATYMYHLYLGNNYS